MILFASPYACRDGGSKPEFPSGAATFISTVECAAKVLTAIARRPRRINRRSRLQRPKLTARTSARNGRKRAATTMETGLSSRIPVARRLNFNRTCGTQECARHAVSGHRTAEDGAELFNWSTSARPAEMPAAAPGADQTGRRRRGLRRRAGRDKGTLGYTGFAPEARETQRNGEKPRVS